MAVASDPTRSRARFALDASVALAWCFSDERSTYANSVLRSLATGRAVVPPLWPYEMANALLSAERRRRSTSDNTLVWLGFLQQLPITVDEKPVSRSSNSLLGLAREHDVSAYDAAYLELAFRLGLPLATLDRRLQKAARSAGIALYTA